MNSTQENALKQRLVSIRIEKQTLQEQKAEINAERDTAIANINARIDAINTEILTLKEGLE